MKFTVAALTLASSAMAGIAVRDATIVNNVISTVSSDLDAVKTAADSYSGDKTALVKASDQLISDLKSGTAEVEAGPDMNVEDAIGLASSVNKLADAGQGLTEALDSKKSDVEKAGECKTVQDSIAAISTNSKALIDAVVSKVPTQAQSIASELANKVTEVLKKAQDSYQDCKDATGGSSTAPATSSEQPASTSVNSSVEPSTAIPSTSVATAQPSSSVQPSVQPSGSVVHSSGSVAPTGTPKHTGSVTPTGGVKPSSTHVTVPTGAAALYAPAGLFAAAAAALAL